MTDFQSVFAYGPRGDDEPEETFVPPPWFGPSDDELGTCVPLSLVVGRSEKAVVVLEYATAYSSGAELAVRAAGRGLRDRDVQRLLHQHHGPVGDDDVDEGFLRIGIELADGAKASNLGHDRRFTQPEQEPSGPVLIQHRGSGGGGGAGRIDLHATYWLWPLPPPGPLRVFVEWPAVGIPLTHAALEADVLLEAAARSRPLWDE